MRIVREPLKPEEVAALAAETFGDMIKLVVDVRQEILVAGGALHADGEQLLLDDGSDQNDLWGANYFPAKASSKRLEYSSMINQYHPGNKDSQTIKDLTVREHTRAIVTRYFGDV